MKTLLAKKNGRGTIDYFANALVHDIRVVSDFAGDVMMILPDLVRRVRPNEIPKLKAFCLLAPAVLFSDRTAAFRAGLFLRWRMAARRLEAFLAILCPIALPRVPIRAYQFTRCSATERKPKV
jgi:hypothetical protein